MVHDSVFTPANTLLVLFFFFVGKGETIKVHWSNVSPSPVPKGMKKTSVKGAERDFDALLMKRHCIYLIGYPDAFVTFFETGHAAFLFCATRGVKRTMALDNTGFDNHFT